MIPPLPLFLTAASLLSFTNALYSSSSPVLQVDASSYQSLIAKSNHTSIVEFYAPWCGHCKNLKPAYEKAAKSLSGLAKVAAVDCDDDSNKQFCSQMGVQGFPTLKIVKPGKRFGHPVVEEYQGARSAKAIVDTVVGKIPNHVKRLKDADFAAWLEEGGTGPKAILFSSKGTTSALLKAVAVDFLGSIEVAQVRDKETEAVNTFDITSFPTLILLPGNGKDAIAYEGEMKKESMVAFLSQAAAPNPDSAAKKAKSSGANKVKRPADASQTAETLQDDSLPTESPDPRVGSQKPIELDIAPAIAVLADGLSLQQKCLNTKAGTCILALLPDEATENSVQAVSSLSDVHYKHARAQRNLFPFYQLPTTNSQATALRKKLSLGQDVEVIATNGKRNWYRHYPKASFTQAEMEDWIDAIRMGDVPKQPIPAGLVMDAADLPPEPVKVDMDAMEKMRETMKDQIPQGMEFEMEEIDDATYEKLMAQGGKTKDETGNEQEEQQHVEL